nr:proline-rich receptor-like protein kinase PERK2 [Aegilops tauschii subsp. strangulata]
MPQLPGTPAGTTLPPAVAGAGTSSSSLVLIPPPSDANAPPPLDIGAVAVRRTTAARRPRRLDLFPVVDPATVADPSPSSTLPDHIEPRRHLCSPTPVRAVPSYSPLYPVCHDLVRRSPLPPDPRAGRTQCVRPQPPAVLCPLLLRPARCLRPTSASPPRCIAALRL